jgi:uncharacterized protein YecE (DUF72 family)
MKGTIRVGIGGWTFEPWRETFYPKNLPQRQELEYASRQLTSIEINGTYYRTQRAESFARWHEETPDGFVFALKGPRFAINRRILAEAEASIERFFASGVMNLKEKLGPINWQFLPTKRYDSADFEAFLKLLPKSVDGRKICHAVEVRHDSFRTAEFIEVLRSYQAGAVFTDKDQFPQIPDVTSSFVYARLQCAAKEEESGRPAPAIPKSFTLARCGRGLPWQWGYLDRRRARADKTRLPWRDYRIFHKQAQAPPRPGHFCCRH